MPPSRTSLIAAWCLAAAIGLAIAFGPPQLLDLIQQSVADGTRVGLQLIDSAAPGEPSIEKSPAIDSAQMSALRQANASLKLQVAQLQESLERQSQLNEYPLAAMPAEPLVKEELIVASVLGETGVLNASPDRLLDLGRIHGLSGAELVASGEGVLLDQGRKSGLASDQLVVDGRTLVGRISTVGRWTSRLQPVSHPAFRTGARLVRNSSTGPVFGARGVLAGDGVGCRLEQVPGVEAVSVGDAVYCDSSTTGQSLIIGRVTAAALEPAAPFWTIEVTPERRDSFRRVLVLKSAFNPARLANRETP
jgi:cell shape-determining protein MreC